MHRVRLSGIIGFFFSFSFRIYARLAYPIGWTTEGGPAPWLDTKWATGEPHSLDAQRQRMRMCACVRERYLFFLSVTRFWGRIQLRKNILFEVAPPGETCRPSLFSF